jgi:hydroxymethylpyrimidine kinase/phosphomethylpyrimidine kinase
MQTSQIGRKASATKSGSDGAPITVVVLGGLDPGGGAGLLRDVFTARSLGAHPVAVGTAWTEQGAGVHRVEARDPEALRDSVRHAIGPGPAAVKIGMVCDAGQAAAIVEGLDGFGGPVVVDPVLATSRGGRLFAGAPDELGPLLRRATLVTPNAPEAAILTGRPVDDLAAAAEAAQLLVARGAEAALIKGGHLPGAEVTDTLFSSGALERLSRPRVLGPDVRGTGCALATAIAVHLGRGLALLPAVEAATVWLARAFAASVDVGSERHLGLI